MPCLVLDRIDDRLDALGDVKRLPEMGAPVTEADVRNWCEGNLTGYKRPKIVEFRTELPKTPVGKVLRRELRDKAAAR